MVIKTIDSEALCGYKQITTFFEDFSIADCYGISAITDTYERVFESWKSDYKYLTELVMVLNWKIWQHWEEKNESVARVYDYLWRKAQDYAYEHLKGDELSYFFNTTN